MSHIAVLVLTFFHRHMPQLIENGNIFIGLAPLYIVRKGTKIHSFLSNEREKEKWFLSLVRKEYDIPKKSKLSDIDDEIISEVTKGYTLNYLKGLGKIFAQLKSL